MDQLGAGGMGIVYRAEDTKLGRTVALKFLPPGLTADSEQRARLLREARAASQLDHPNIGTIYSIEESDDSQIFIVMACYEGETLKSRIRRGHLSEKEACTIAAQVAEGLREAHSKGVVHRDIKPSNLILTPQGVVKIIDFGLAKFRDLETQTYSGNVTGTPAYMSPEQALGKHVDKRRSMGAGGKTKKLHLRRSVNPGDSFLYDVAAPSTLIKGRLRMDSGGGIIVDA